MFHLSHRGFSFIEILLVLSIVSILSVLASVFYSQFLTQNSVANTTDHLISQLRRAQIYSMEGKQNGGSWGVKYTLSPKQITFYLQGNPAFDENYAVNSNVNFSQAFDIVFTHYTGVPTGVTLPFIVTITGNNSTRGITVNAEGVVSKN